MNEDKVIRLIAEFIDGMSYEGSYPSAIDVQMLRALRKAKLDSSLLDRSKTWLAKQDRI